MTGKSTNLEASSQMATKMATLPAVIEPLEEIRRKLLTTLDLLDQELEPAARADLASALVGVCSQYEDVKERVIYPALRVIVPDSDELDRAEEDQREVRQALTEIRRRSRHVKPAYVYADDPEGFEEALSGMLHAVRGHITHEDEVLLPLLATLDGPTGEELHNDVEHAVAHASTHPNPPHNPIGRAIVAVQEKLERDVKDESTAWHPGVGLLNEELASAPAPDDGPSHKG